MRQILSSMLLVAACLLREATSAPLPVVPVHPGNKYDVVITEDNTVNATTPAPAHASNAAVSKMAASAGQLPMALVNNFGGGSVKAYVTGLDSQNRLVMLQPNGAFYYPTASSSQTTPQPITANVAIPLGGKGSTTRITIPGYISAARVWFAAGDLHFFTVWNPATNAPSLVEPSAVNPSDPSAAVNWGFVELTYTANGGLYANISYVDFVGMILGMSLAITDGSTQSAKGLQANAVTSICNDLKAQANSDGQPWDDFCMVDGYGNPLRVLAPFDYVASNPSSFSTYWNEYIDQVWGQYTNNALTINTQAAAGKVACQVKNNLLTCNGDNRGYAKPTAGDIFGCNSGPFAIQSGDNDVHRAVVPRLCAAFHRSTLTMTGGNDQPALPSTDYYKGAPTNWYSKFVHDYEVDGRGYAFPYDDVNPDGGVDQSGVVASPNPQTLTVIVGGPL